MLTYYFVLIRISMISIFQINLYDNVNVDYSFSFQALSPTRNICFCYPF